MVDGRNRTEELFAAWLAENVPSARLSEVYIYCSEIESYCQKIKVLRRPLFETTDMDTVRLVQKTVAESRLFQLSHKGQMKKIVAAAQYYATFVKTLSAEAESATILPPPRENNSNIAQNKTEENIQKITNEKINSGEIIQNSDNLKTEEGRSAPADTARKAAARAAIAAYTAGKTPLEVLRAPRVRYEFAGETLGVYANAAKLLDNAEKKNTLISGERLTDRQLFNSHLKRLTERISADASGARRLNRAAGLSHVAAMARMLGYFDYHADSRDFDYLALAMQQNGGSEVTAGAATKAVCALFSAKLNNINALELIDAAEPQAGAEGEREEKTETEQPKGVQGGGEIKTETKKEPAAAEFNALFEDKKYKLLYRELGRAGITTLEGLKSINLWSFMNLRELYTFQQRAAISAELTAKLKCREKEEARAADAPAKEAIRPAARQKEAPRPSGAIDRDPGLAREAEEFLQQRELEGVTYEELQGRLHCTMAITKGIVAQSKNVIEMNRRLYHVDALVDLEEGADALESVLDKLLKKNDGIATSKNLYEYARSEMAMFLNDNGITEQQAVYDLARHLFEKLEYYGKRYVFRSNVYISLPEVSADSNIAIIKKYAREKGSTVNIKELEGYICGLGLSAGGLRSAMRIDKEPVFLVYAENEYLLAELMHIDDDFLKAVHSALRRLFADSDGHIIPRNIAESWYCLLPGLPASLPWTPMLLQQLIRFYPNELQARSIIAMESQNSNTLHAMFVDKDSWIQDFRDAVAVFLSEEMPERSEFEAKELRQILGRAGMISGSQLNGNMHTALGGDPRFLWNRDGSHVKVRII